MPFTKVFLGVDVGSTTVKVVVLDETRQLLAWRYLRSRGRPRSVLREIIREIGATVDLSHIGGVGLSGSGGGPISDLVGGVHVNELVAQTRAVGEFHPEARTIIEIGGQDSKLLSVRWDEGSHQMMLEDFSMNALCAAGTGAFLDQQAERLGVAIDGEFARLALDSTSPSRIAGRCTVFAKSDMIHLQQIGTPLSDILMGVCLAMARNFTTVIGKGKRFTAPILFQGGVAYNGAVTRAFETVLNLSPGSIVVPEHHTIMAALGTAYVTMDELAAGRRAASFVGFDVLADAVQAGGAERQSLPVLTRPLDALEGRPLLGALPGGGQVDAWLGVDVGSVSTNVVLIDAENRVLARRYLPTAGRPLEAVRDGLQMVLDVADRVTVRGAGTTGSGRHLTGDFVGADVVRNGDHGAGPRGRGHRSRGGHGHRDRRPGQQVHPSAERRGHRLHHEQRLRRRHRLVPAGAGRPSEDQGRGPVQRPGVLIALPGGPGRALHGVHGVRRRAPPAARRPGAGPDCRARLLHRRELPESRGQQPAARQSYLLPGRRGGQRFGGGGVPRAHAPAHYGAAESRHHWRHRRGHPGPRGDGAPGRPGHGGHHSLPRLRPHRPPLRERGLRVPRVSESVRGAEDRHRGRGAGVLRGPLRQVRGSRTRCEHDVARHPGPVRRTAGRAAGRLDRPRPARPCRASERPRVGLLRNLTFFDLFPFWWAFLDRLGCDVVLSTPTNPEVVRYTHESAVAESCFPVKLAFGHLVDVVRQDVDIVFLPSMLTREHPAPGQTHNHYCPLIPATPHLLMHNLPAGLAMPRLVNQSLHFHNERACGHELHALAAQLTRASAREADAATAAGWAALQQFSATLSARGREVMASLHEGLPAAVVVGRPYTANDAGANLDLPYKLRRLGVLPLPMDFLPLDDVAVPDRYDDMFWRSGQDILRAGVIVRDDPRLQALYLTNFNCGPDAFLLSYFRQTLGSKPFLELEVDDHTADAGMITRCEAFFDSLNLARAS